MKSSFKQHALKVSIVAAFALAGAGFGADGFAATNTGAFAVTATVAAACTIAGTTLGFGSLNVISGSNVDSTSTLTATCTNGSAYTVGLNEGLSVGATVSTRKMTHTNTVNTLNYRLVTVSQAGSNWDDVGGANVASGTGNGVGQNITVYGRVPTGQTGPIVGDYSDTITATIDF
jgi:spore coat protein U-like protein